MRWSQSIPGTILGDADGVVAIPVGAIEECVQLRMPTLEERWAIDEETLECLEKGEDLNGTNI